MVDRPTLFRWLLYGVEQRQAAGTRNSVRHVRRDRSRGCLASYASLPSCQSSFLAIHCSFRVISMGFVIEIHSFRQVATVNLNDVRSMRSNFIARSYQASSTPTVHRIEAGALLWKTSVFSTCQCGELCHGFQVDFSLGHPDPLSISESQPIESLRFKPTLQRARATFPQPQAKD